MRDGKSQCRQHASPSINVSEQLSAVFSSASASILSSKLLIVLVDAAIVGSELVFDATGCLPTREPEPVRLELQFSRSTNCTSNISKSIGGSGVSKSVASSATARNMCVRLKTQRQCESNRLSSGMLSSKELHLKHILLVTDLQPEQSSGIAYIGYTAYFPQCILLENTFGPRPRHISIGG